MSRTYFLVARNFNAAPTNSTLESSNVQRKTFISISRVRSIRIIILLLVSLLKASFLQI